MFLIFGRADRHPWKVIDQADNISLATKLAEMAVSGTAIDRVVVMEVSGVDAVPSFTYRFGAKR